MLCKKKIFLFFIVFVSSIVIPQQREIFKLWQDKPLYQTDFENREKSETGTDKIIRVSDVTYPTIEYWKPKKPNGTAVIICPGGGYVRLSMTSEGDYPAKWFAENGTSAFVLKTRLPNDSTMQRKEIVPLADAQQAIYYIKNNSERFGIDTNKIGIMGFSAGGHLAASASTLYKDSFIKKEKNLSLRPNFTILIYPVITMENTFTHRGSKKALIGENASESLVNYLSNEKNVTADSPPAFIMHASDDKSVPVENSIKYYDALKSKNVNVALHIFQKGGHGFAMKNKVLDEQWYYLLKNWMIENKLL
jgi:acetyl esterase/lipase